MEVSYYLGVSLFNVILCDIKGVISRGLEEVVPEQLKMGCSERAHQQASACLAPMPLRACSRLSKQQPATGKVRSDCRLVPSPFGASGLKPPLEFGLF